MITAILIITLISLTINFICFVLLKWNQLYYWDSLTTRQNHVTNELIEIGMTVRATNEKVEQVRKKIKELKTKEDEQSK